MDYLDRNEEFEIDSSWISIASLKKAADISTIIENFQSEYTMPVNMSTSSDLKALEHMSESVSYNKLHFSQEKSKSTRHMPNLFTRFKNSTKKSQSCPSN